MAELLIYNGTQWMDTLTPEERTAQKGADAEWERKFAARYQRGHVVEVREDGFWRDGPYPRADVFRVVRVPGIKATDLSYLLAPGAVERRRYVVVSGADKSVVTVALQDLSVIDRSLARG